MNRTRPSKTLLFMTLVCGMSLVVPAAQSQDTTATSLMRRIERLEQDLTVLQRDYFQGQQREYPAYQPPSYGDPGPIDQAASFEVRLTELGNEFRSLTGSVEDLQHSIDVLDRDFRRLVEDMEFRFQELESGNTGPASMPPAALGDPDGAELLATGSEPVPGVQQPANVTALLPEGDAVAQYNYARRLVIQARMEEAEQALAAFLEQHGMSELAPNAQYWLGETYYFRQMYDEAAVAFVTGLQTYGESDKGPDFLLKLGMSLIAIGQTDDGCAALETLPTRYPDAPAEVTVRANEEAATASCR